MWLGSAWIMPHSPHPSRIMPAHPPGRSHGVGAVRCSLLLLLLWGEGTGWLAGSQASSS